jgi:hypothetical protein
MTEHSAGPWIARSHRHHSPSTVLRESDGTPIAEVDPVDGYGNHPETIANARLIAAAPDLLALAKQYAAECGECDGSGVRQFADEFTPAGAQCPDCIGIRAVINKAEQAP